MNNINLQCSANRMKSVNKLIEKIDSTCNALLDTLTLTPQSVGNYGISLSQTIDSEFVDRVIKNIWKLKNHLKDIKEHMDFIETNNKWLEEITQSLTQTSDNLNEIAGSNNYFYNTFGRAIQEVTTMIDKLLDKLPVGAYSLVTSF